MKFFFNFEVLTWERGQPRDFDVSVNGNHQPLLQAELNRMFRAEQVHVFHRRLTAAGSPAPAIPIHPFFRGSSVGEDFDGQMFDLTLC
jgi:hypothetical protein